MLERALQLLVEGGERGVTTEQVARAAKCSKESLYRWFGDRNGLLAAMVAHQAGKVRVEEPGRAGVSRAAFYGQLVAFADGLLAVLSGEVSLALNRLAIGAASRDDGELGRLVLERGRRTIEARARGLLDAGRAAGHLDFTDAGEAFATLYGLIVRDRHIRLLLGEGPEAAPAAAESRAREAARAVDQFFRLYGTG